jgi:hypothetical protein
MPKSSDENIVKQGASFVFFFYFLIPLSFLSAVSKQQGRDAMNRPNSARG